MNYDAQVIKAQASKNETSSRTSREVKRSHNDAVTAKDSF